MTYRMNIKTIIKMLMIILSAMFMLTACSDDKTRALTDEEIERNVKDQQECWQAPILDSIYDIMGATVMKMYSTVTTGAMNIMMIGFAIWLALRLLKFLSSVSEENAAEVWNEVLRKAFICLFCGILASSPQMSLYVLNTLIFPLYNAFLEFGSEILSVSTATVTGTTSGGLPSTVLVMGDEVNFSKYSLTCATTAEMGATLEGFPAGPKEMMSCMVCAVSSRLTLGIRVAQIVMTGDGLTQFVIGFLIWGSFIVVYIGFVFYLVDTLFRFAMMVLMLPIFIMAYAFGPTKSWTSTGFKNILNAAAFMMAFSIMVSMALTAMVLLITDKPEVFNPANPQQHFSDFSIAMLCLLLIAFLILGSLKIAQQLSSALVGGKSSAKFQQYLKTLGQMALGFATAGATAMLSKIGFVAAARGKMGALKGRMNKLSGRKESRDSLLRKSLKTAAKGHGKAQDQSKYNG